MTTFVVPNAEEVTNLLQLLYGDIITSSEADVDDLADFRIATFVDDNDVVVALIHCDIQAVVNSGAALSMIPPGGAEDMIRSKDVTKAVGGNFHEVMNICSKLLMTDTGAHLRLGKVVEAAEAADSVAIQSVYPTATKVGFALDIEGYGAGKMAVFVT